MLGTEETEPMLPTDQPGGTGNTAIDLVRGLRGTDDSFDQATGAGGSFNGVRNTTDSFDEARSAGDLFDGARGTVDSRNAFLDA